MNYTTWSIGDSRCTAFLLLALSSAIVGCGQDSIQVYKVAKQAPAPPAVGAPAGWEAAPPGEMRVASFRVKGQTGKQADVSVIPLPGKAGADIDNVNRWRGQVGLAPVAESELGNLSQSVEISGQSAQLYDMAGQNPSSGEKQRILATISRRDDTAWFFKMTGDSDLVGEQKAAFISYLKTFDFNRTAPEPSGQETSSLPSSHPPLGGTGNLGEKAQLPPDHPALGGGTAPLAQASAGISSSERKPEWQVPAGWKEIVGGPFLISKFSVPGKDNSQATVNVSMSAGSGGGIVMNVNRWRGQLGLGELPEAEISKLATTVDIADGKATVIDMIGTDVKTGQKARMIAAIVPRSQQTWFYKLTGAGPVVDQNKDAFFVFVQSVKYTQ